MRFLRMLPDVRLLSGIFESTATYVPKEVEALGFTPTIYLIESPAVFTPATSDVDTTKPAEEATDLTATPSAVYVALQTIWAQAGDILAPDDPLEEEAFLLLDMQRLGEEQIALWQDNDIFYDAIDFFPELTTAQPRLLANNDEPTERAVHSRGQSISVREAFRKVRHSADRVSRRLAILSNGAPGKKKEKLD